MMMKLRNNPQPAAQCCALEDHPVELGFVRFWVVVATLSLATQLHCKRAVLDTKSHNGFTYYLDKDTI